MSREDWELASWMATTIASVLAVVGLFVVAVQLHWQRRESRLEFLNHLYTEFDTHEARLAREYIYTTPTSLLRLETLHSKDRSEDRRKVEETLAMLERVAYPIVMRQLRSKDAFNLYGGVFF